MKYSEIINEIIGNKSIDSLELHNQLNPDLWDESMKLKPEIRSKMLEIAKEFILSVDSINIKFSDIIFTGSMANYNYNENSDIDIHIVLDFKSISDDSEFLSEFFKMKKDLWSNKYPIKIKNHDVELYFQDVNEEHHSTGVYSILNNLWIKKPTNKIIDINTNLVMKKANDFTNLINALKNETQLNDFLKKYKLILEKIKSYRKCGLEKNGEYSIENLAFKIIRNNGVLNNLKTLKDDMITKSLSLNENK